MIASHPGGRRLARLLLLLLLLTPLAPSAALAHATLLGSSPADGAALEAPPDRILLTFDEPVRPLGIALREAERGPIESGAAEAAGNELVIPLPAALPRGRYLLSWRVTSLDGHLVSGSFAFAVGQDLAPPEGHLAAADPWRWPGLALHLAARLSLLLAAGGALFLLLAAEGRWRRLDRFARRAAAVALAIGLAALYLGGARFSGQSPWAAAPGPLLDALAAAPGLPVWLAGLGALALLALPLPRLPRLLAAVAAPVSLAGSGHALAAWPLAAAPLMWLHGLAAAAWIGALPPLRWALDLPEQQPWPLFRRFQTLGLAAVLLVIASGTALGLAILDDWALLWRSDYGLILLGKLALVLAMLSIALLNRLLLTRRAMQSKAGRRRLALVLRLDFVVALLVVVLATGLSLGPPRAAARPVVFTLGDSGWRVEATVTPGRAGDSTLSLAVRDLAGEAAVIAGGRARLAVPEAGIGPLTATLRQGEDGLWRAEGLPLWHPGPWSLRLDLLVDSYTSRKLEGAFTLSR